MKPIFLLIIFCGIVVHSFCNDKSTYIKVSFNDCVNCVAHIENILNINSKAKILLREVDEEDRNDILHKYGLQNLKNNLIFNDSLYNRYGKEMFSEIICVNKEDKIIYSSNLKEFNIYLYKLLTNSSDCKYKSPSSAKLSNTDSLLSLWHYNTDSYYEITYDYIRHFVLEDEFVKILYTDFLKDETNVNYHLNEIKSKFYLKPSIHQFFAHNKYKYLLANLKYLEPVKGEDSIYGSFNYLCKYYNDSLISYHFINPHNVNQYIYCNTSSVFIYNDTLYVKNGYNQMNFLPDIKYTIISQYIIKDNQYVFYKELPYLLPEYLINQKIGYNAFAFIKDKNYISTMLGDYIIDLKSKITFKIPLADTVFLLNKNLITELKAGYELLDIKLINDNARTYNMLYSINQNLYISKVENNKIVNTQFLYNYNDKNANSIHNTCLDNTGKGILYKIKKENCIFHLKIY